MNQWEETRDKSQSLQGWHQWQRRMGLNEQHAIVVSRSMRTGEATRRADLLENPDRYGGMPYGGRSGDSVGISMASVDSRQALMPQVDDTPEKWRSTRQHASSELQFADKCEKNSDLGRGCAEGGANQGANLRQSLRSAG